LLQQCDSQINDNLPLPNGIQNPAYRFAVNELKRQLFGVAFFYALLSENKLKDFERL